MHNSKLIEILRKFDKKEINGFYDYVCSPYFNKEKVIMNLTEHLKKSYPDFKEEFIQKEKVYKKLYPGKKYNDSVMRNVLSKTMRLAEDFLTLKEFEYNTDYYRTILSLRGAGEKKLEFLFSKADERAKKYIDSLPYRDGMYYFLKFMYEDEVRRFAMRKESRMYLKEDNIQKVADNLISFFVTELLRTYAVMLNTHKHNFERVLNFDFFNGMLKVFEDNIEQFSENRYANLYYNSIKLFLTEEEEHFDRIRELTRDNYETLPIIDRKNAYVVQINYCAERVNKGDLDFLSKKLEIYKEVLDRKAHYEGLPYISHVLYTGIAFAAINRGEMDWAMKFINTYRNELTDIHRDNSYYIVMSEYYLNMGDIDRALESLSKVKRNDPVYKEEVYFLLMKIFYTSGMTEQFYSEVESFRNFIQHSREISERRKKLARSFITLIKKLYSFKQNKEIGKRTDYISLREDIIKNEYVSDKFWLLEKLTELE